MREKYGQLGRKLRMTFYESSEGPYVMIFGPIDTELEALRDCFRTLSSGGGAVQLEEAQFIVAFGGITLLAKCFDVNTSRGRSQRRRVLRSGPAGLTFVWSQSPDEWAITTELVEGLINSPRAGHQYLSDYPNVSDYPTDDAIIVVSKGEFDDTVLTQNRQ